MVMVYNEPLAVEGEMVPHNMTFKKPRILLAASGSVASVKFENLCRCFSEWAEVRAVATSAALHFIDRASLPKDVVLYTDEDEWATWSKIGDSVLHIELRKWADIMVIAPLSANTLGKIAGGLCDNLLTCIVRAWDYSKPLFVAPAMNTMMWNNPFTERHLMLANELGIIHIPPVTKTLACGDYGNGSMAEPSTINSTVRIFLESRSQAVTGGVNQMDLNLNEKKSASTEDNMAIEETTHTVMPIEGTTHTVRTPIVGMEFDTIEMIDEFWKQYGREIGFGGRIQYTSKSKKDGTTVLGRSYVCCRAGLKCEDKRRINSKRRPETRCQCPVRLVVCFNKDKGRFYVKSFEGNHNHLLENKGTVHFLRAYRAINKVQARAIDVASRAGLGPAAIYRYMTVEAGGSDRLGFTIEEVRSYLRTKRMKNLHSGEATTIIDSKQNSSKDK